MAVAKSFNASSLPFVFCKIPVSAEIKADSKSALYDHLHDNAIITWDALNSSIASAVSN